MEPRPSWAQRFSGSSGLLLHLPPSVPVGLVGLSKFSSGVSVIFVLSGEGVLTCGRQTDTAPLRRTSVFRQWMLSVLPAVASHVESW